MTRLVLLAPVISAASACGGGGDDRMPPQLAHQEGLAKPFDDPAPGAVREIWLALADEPSAHMEFARGLFETGDWTGAARELEKSAALFRWGRHYASGAKEGKDFVVTAQELEESARFLREGSGQGVEPLYRILASGYRVLAGHHSGAALHEWEAGEHVRVALLLGTAATEVERGFSLSGEAFGSSIRDAVRAAREVADRLESSRPPPERDVRAAIEGLGEAATGLPEILGSRRH